MDDSEYIKMILSSGDDSLEDYYEKQRDFELKINAMAPVDCMMYVLENWNDCFEEIVYKYLYDRKKTLTVNEKSEMFKIMERYSDSEDIDIRYGLAIMFRFVCTTDFSPIEKLLCDKDISIRFEALESLVKVAGAKVADRVVEIFRTDEDYTVRIVALRQLSTIKGVNLTYIFMEALETTDIVEIYADACIALAERKNRRVYRFLRWNYIRTRSFFKRIFLSYALYLHGERDKLKKILSALTATGKDNLFVKYEAGLFLELIYWKSDYKTRMLICERLKDVLLREKQAMMIEEIRYSLEEMEPDIQRYLRDRNNCFVAGRRTKPFFRSND